MKSRGGPSRGGFNHRGGTYRGRGQSNAGSHRDGRKPARTINVLLEFQRETLGRERQKMETDWNVETGCEIVPVIYDFRPLVITAFKIFGTGKDLDTAVEKVEGWIRSAKTKSAATTAWSKISAYDPKAWFQGYDQSQIEERKRQFTKDMPEQWTTDYKSLITVKWPQDLRDDGVTMKDALGTGLAKLDPIRMEEEVFITPVTSHELEIRGSDINRARIAEQRLNVVIEKVQKKISDELYPKYILLDEREGSAEGIICERAAAWWPDHLTHPIAPRMLRCVMTSSNPGEYWQDIQSSQRLEIQDEIQRALDNARYEKGYHDFTIRLGCLAVTEHSFNLGSKQNTASFFEAITTEKQVDCVVKNWLVNDDDGEQLLSRLVAANDLLEPIAASTGGFGFAVMPPRTLVEPKPTLRGTWVFEDPNGTSLNYVVQLYWTIDEMGLYEKEQSRFYRLAADRDAPTENLDVKLLELGQAKGWQFSLASMSIVSSRVVPAALEQFAEMVQVKRNYDTTSKGPFADFKVSRSLRIVTRRLDKLYTFGIRKTGYRLEVLSMWYPRNKLPCWGLNVYHNEWRSHLALLEHLSLGQRADWGNTLNTFLPNDGFSALGQANVVADQPKGVSQISRNETPELDQEGKAIPRDGIRILLMKLMEISQVVYQAGDSEIPEFPAIPPSPRGSVPR